MNIIQVIRWVVALTLTTFPLPVDMKIRTEEVDGSSDEDVSEEETYDHEDVQEYAVVKAMADVQMRQRWGKDMSHID